MSVADDLLDAAAALQQYMLHAISPMPALTKLPANNYDMGPLHDYWVTQTIRIGREAQAALDRVKLVSRESAAGAKHLQQYLQILQDRFEHTLSYKTPYSSTGNPHGMVRPPIRPENNNHKMYIWLVHRAISMQILVLHLTRLQFLILATRADDMGNQSLLDDAFDVKMNEALNVIATTMADQGRMALSGSGTAYLAEFIKDRDYTAFLSELTDAVETLTHHDTTEAVCTDFTTRLFDGREIALNLIRQALNSDRIDTSLTGDVVANRLWNRFIGYNATVSNLNAHTLAAAQHDNTALPTEGPADENELGKLEEAFENGEGWRDVFDIQPDQDRNNLFWIVTCSKLTEAVEKFYITQEAGAAAVAVDPTDRAGMRALRLPVLNFTYMPRSTNPYTAEELEAHLVVLRSKSIPLMMRYFAFTMSQMACSPPEATTGEYRASLSALTKHTQDASLITSGVYTELKRDIHGFLPKWNDDREYLHVRARNPTVLSSFPYQNAQPADGVFVYNQRRVTQHRVVRLWRKATAWGNSCQSLWALAHCEATLMSDVYRLMGKLTIANREATVNRTFPHSAVQDVLAGILQKSVTLQHTNHTVAELIRGAALLQNVVDPIRDTYAQMLREAEPNESGNTTQPMPSGTRDWIGNISRLLLEHEGIYVVPGTTLDTFTRHYRRMYAFEQIPSVLNATSLPTLAPADGRTFPVARSPLPDRFKTDNEVVFEPLPPDLYALLVTNASEIHKTSIGMILGANCLSNSATLVHLSEACKALVRDWDRDQPPLIPYINEPELRFTVQLDTNPLPVTFVDPTPAGGDSPATDIIGTAERNVLHFISMAIDQNVPMLFVHKPKALHAIRTEFHTRIERMHREYAARHPPFIFPSLWLNSVTNNDITDDNWAEVEANDRIDGVVFQLPVPPPAPAAAGAAAAAPVPHAAAPAWFAGLRYALRLTRPIYLDR